MNERARPSRPASLPDADSDILKRLAGLHLTLADLLGAVDDHAQWMDASLEDAHRLVEEVRSYARQRVFFPRRGPEDPSAYPKNVKEFEKARTAENDAYAVYSYVLECYQRRRLKDLSVAESDSDQLALVKRRRDYISRLATFQSRTSVLLGELRR